MIVVKVELWSAITHQVTELARMEICNDATEPNPNFGNYTVTTLRGRDKASLDKRVKNRIGAVNHYPRLALHIWNLVAQALASVDYGKGGKTSETCVDFKEE